MDYIMNERLRFSWGHIIAFIALIVVSYTSFVGFTYLTGGNFIYGAVGMAVTDIVFIFIFIGAQQLKASGVKMKKKLVWERILVFGSPLVFVAGMISMSHFWTVRDQEDEVVADFNNSLSNGKAIFDDYETYANNRIEAYDRSLSQIIAEGRTNPDLYRKAGFTPGIEEVQKENMVEVLRMQLLSSNFDSLRNLATTWIDNANEGASTFNVFLLGNTREISEALKNWETQLMEMSRKKLSNEELIAPVREFDTTAGSAASRQIYDLGVRFTRQRIPTVAAVIFGLIIYFMMIFPYLIQERHSKSVYSLSGGKEKGGKNRKGDPDADPFEMAEGENESKVEEENDFPVF